MDLYKIAVEATNMKIQKDQAFANNALDYQKLISTQEERIRAIILPVLKAGADQLSKAGIESSVVHHIQKDNDRPRVSLKLTFNGRSVID